MLERLDIGADREHRLLGELPTYVFNCFRAEPQPIRRFPVIFATRGGSSRSEVPPHALALAGRRLRAAMSPPRARPRASRSESGEAR